MAWSVTLPVLTLLVGVGIGVGCSRFLHRHERSAQQLAKHQWLEKRSQAYTDIIAELWHMLLLDDRSLYDEGPRGFGPSSSAALSPTHPALFHQHYLALQQAVSRGSAAISQEAASQLAQYLHELERLVDCDEACAEVRYELTRACWVTMRSWAWNEVGVDPGFGDHHEI